MSSLANLFFRYLPHITSANCIRLIRFTWVETEYYWNWKPKLFFFVNITLLRLIYPRAVCMSHQICICSCEDMLIQYQSNFNPLFLPQPLDRRPRRQKRGPRSTSCRSCWSLTPRWSDRVHKQIKKLIGKAGRHSQTFSLVKLDREFTEVVMKEENQSLLTS